MLQKETSQLIFLHIAGKIFIADKESKYRSLFFIMSRPVQSLQKCCSEHSKTTIYISFLKELWKDDGAQEVTGSIGVIHQFVDMPSQKVEHLDPVTNKPVKVSIENSRYLVSVYRFAFLERVIYSIRSATSFLEEHIVRYVVKYY